MPWFKTDDALHSHPKARKAGLPAMGLWVLAGSHAMQYMTDGFVPAWYVASWPQGKRCAASLVAAGLWTPASSGEEKGWQFKDWAHYQPTREEIEAERAATRERQERFRKARREQKRKSQEKSTDKAIEAMRNGVTNDVTDGVSDGVTNSPPLPSRSLPVPSPSITNSPSEGKETSVTRKESTEPPMQICGRRHPESQGCQGCARQRIALEEAERKEKLEAKSSAARHDARLRQEAIDACGMCDERGYLANGKVCHHVESVGMSDSVRESLKSLKETKQGPQPRLATGKGES